MSSYPKDNDKNALEQEYDEKWKVMADEAVRRYKEETDQKIAELKREAEAEIEACKQGQKPFAAEIVSQYSETLVKTHIEFEDLATVLSDCQSKCEALKEEAETAQKKVDDTKEERKAITAENKAILDMNKETAQQYKDIYEALMMGKFASSFSNALADNGKEVFKVTNAEFEEAEGESNLAKIHDVLISRNETDLTGYDLSALPFRIESVAQLKALIESFGIPIKKRNTTTHHGAGGDARLSVKNMKTSKKALVDILEQGDGLPKNDAAGIRAQSVQNLRSFHKEEKAKKWKADGGANKNKENVKN